MRCNLQQNRGARYHCRLTVITFAVHIHPRRMQRVLFSALRILPLTAFAPVFDGSGAGNGGAGGDGSGAGKPGGDDATKTGIDEARANELITKALNSRFADFEKKQAKATEVSHAKLLETFGTTLDEKLAALKTPADDSDKGKGKPAATDVTQSPEFRAMKKQLDDQQRLLDQAKIDRETEKTKARQEALNRKVEAELRALGIDDAESARILLQGKDLVGYEEDDSESIVFRDEGGALPLKKGLETWAKSAVGDRFMPPRGAKGSGDRNGGGRKQVVNGSQPTTDELGTAMARELGITISS